MYVILNYHNEVDMEYISLNKKTFRNLKLRYEEAIINKQDKFDFTCEGITHQFNTSYAKYFIEYHEPKFKHSNRMSS